MLLQIAFWVFGTLIVYTIVGYPVLLAVLARLRRKPAAVSGGFPMVSMLIAAHNEAAVLSGKLNNCRMLDYPADCLEVVLGSDGSTDDTATLGLAHGARVLEFEQRRGKAAVLNDLAAAALGDILVFSDANTMFGFGALRALVAPMADPAVGGVCGRLELLPGDCATDGQGEQLYQRYENKLKQWEGDIRTTVGATGGIYAVRRNLFEPLPVNAGIPDDLMIPLKIAARGFRIVYAHDAVATEHAPIDPAAEMERKVRIGAQDWQALPQVLPYAHPRYGFLALALVSHKLLRWAMPLCMIGVFLCSIPLRNLPPYEWFWLAQIGLYGWAFVGMVGEQIGLKSRLLMMPAYFVLIHAALLKGFISALRQTPQPYWNSVRNHEK